MLGFLPGADDDINRQLRDQNDAWLGRKGGLLRAVSTTDGKKLAECRLDSIPVFDGMSAADGKVLVSLVNGSVVCYGAR